MYSPSGIVHNDPEAHSQKQDHIRKKIPETSTAVRFNIHGPSTSTQNPNRNCLGEGIQEMHYFYS